MYRFRLKQLTACILSFFILFFSTSYFTNYNQPRNSMKKESLVINAIGDSITYGSGTSCTDSIYINQIAKALGADKINNYGIPSSPISRTYNPSLSDAENQNLSFLDRVSQMDKDAGFIFVFGGVNDYSLDVPLGHDYDRSPNTFCGSLNLLFGSLQKQYPASSIIVLTPLKRTDKIGVNAAGHTLEDYVNKINKLSHRYDQVQSIDLYHTSYLDFSDDIHQHYLVDGLHPSDAGQKRIAEYIIHSIGISTLPLLS